MDIKRGMIRLEESIDFILSLSKSWRCKDARDITPKESSVSQNNKKRTAGSPAMENKSKKLKEKKGDMIHINKSLMIENVENLRNPQEDTGQWETVGGKSRKTKFS